MFVDESIKGETVSPAGVEILHIYSRIAVICVGGVGVGVVKVTRSR